MVIHLAKSRKFFVFVFFLKHNSRVHRQNVKFWVRIHVLMVVILLDRATESRMHSVCLLTQGAGLTPGGWGFLCLLHNTGTEQAAALLSCSTHTISAPPAFSRRAHSHAHTSCQIEDCRVCFMEVCRFKDDKVFFFKSIYGSNTKKCSGISFLF